MIRILEPEVMEDAARTAAYARADFSKVNQDFVNRFLAAFPDCGAGELLDLGCGPADIPLRLARDAPTARVTAVDASAQMLLLAQEAVARSGVAGRVKLLNARIPNLPLSSKSFDGIISNSLLHHLPQPGLFWDEIRRLGKSGAAIFVMDLLRPDSKKHAREIVETAAANEDPLLKEDFFNSLLAAFTQDEIRAQLATANLPGLDPWIISDRHWLVSGRL